MPVPRTEDVAAGFQATAKRLDDLEVAKVAPGGTTGQVWGKTSNLDYEAGWINQTGGGGGSSPPFPISDITGLQTALDGKQPLDSDLTSIAALTTTTFGRNQLTYADSSAAKTALSLVKADVGLANVDNTSDLSKPISTATQTALDGKQPLDSDLTAIAALTTTTFGRARLTDADASAAKSALSLTKADVGLGNVDNTSDANKPVSTAQQTALDAKQPLDSDLTAIAALTTTTFGRARLTDADAAAAKTALVLTKADVGLANVDNTSDANKPVSTAQQTALDGKQPLDGDLTALAALTGTNTIYYRSAANTWTAVTIGTNLTFTGGTLSATGGGGGSVAWGAITGTLSDQTDLQAALNAKANVSGQVFTGAISATNLSGTNTGDQTITLTGEATGSGTGSFAVTLSNAAVIGKVLTGYSSGAGTISATDSILSAIQKLNGNDALKAPLNSPTFTGTVTLPAGQVVNGVTLTTGGSATTFLNAAGAYTTPAGGGGGSDPTDPSVAQVIVDEFLMGSLETGEIGALGWSFLNGSVSGVNAAGRPGIVRRTSGATANQVASFFAGNAGTQGILQFGDVDEITWIVSPTTAGADFTIRVGFFDDLTTLGNPVGAHFERLSTDTNWFAKCTIPGTSSTRADTTVALTAGGWFKLKVRRITNTNYGFTINGGTEISITTNTPASTTATNFGMQIIPTTTTARVADIDFMSLKTRSISR